jgi:hypothetical protein
MAMSSRPDSIEQPWRALLTGTDPGMPADAAPASDAFGRSPLQDLQECYSACPAGTIGTEDVQIDRITVENMADDQFEGISAVPLSVKLPPAAGMNFQS